MTAADATL